MIGLGIAGVVATVLFFVITTIQSDRLLARADHVSGTVVGTRPAGSLNPFDYGRLIVRYQVDGTTYIRTIWLDDTRPERVGDTVDVYVDPTQPTLVRTKADANSPVPLGGWVMLGGLCSLALGIAGGTAMHVARRPGARPGTVLRAHEVPVLLDVIPRDGSPAWNAPETRSGWRASLARTALLAAGAALLAGATTTLYLANHRTDEQLLRIAVSTDGRVLDKDSGTKWSQGWELVEYTADGRTLRGRLHAELAYDAEPGDRVEVLYDPRHPERFRSRDDANHSDLVYNARLLGPLLTGLLLFLLAREARRRFQIRGALAKGPWSTWHVDGEGFDPALLRLSGEAGDGRRTLVLRLEQPLASKTLLVRAASGTTVVVAEPTALVPVAATLPGKPDRLAEWQDELEDAQELDEDEPAEIS